MATRTTPPSPILTNRNFVEVDDDHVRAPNPPAMGKQPGEPHLIRLHRAMDWFQARWLDAGHKVLSICLYGQEDVFRYLMEEARHMPSFAHGRLAVQTDRDHVTDSFRYRVFGYPVILLPPHELMEHGISGPVIFMTGGADIVPLYDDRPDIPVMNYRLDKDVGTWRHRQGLDHYPAPIVPTRKKKARG